jgi:elongation factor Ts
VALDQAGKEELAMTVAMQVAAANPKYIEPSEVEAGELEKEKEIYREQLLKEGKPEAMIEKILEGKVTKYYSEVCLVEQEFIKDDKKKVKDILGGAKILGFVRFSL